MTIVYLLYRRADRLEAVSPALLSGALVLVPIAFVPISYALWRVFAKIHDILEAPDGFLPVQAWGARTISSDTISWYGPVGLLLAVGVGSATVILVRRRLLTPVALVFGLAPFVWFVLFALTLAYDPTQGRFFMFPVALSASLWGVILRVERYAVAAVAIATASATLSLVSFYENRRGFVSSTRILSRSWISPTSHSSGRPGAWIAGRPSRLPNGTRSIRSSSLPKFLPCNRCPGTSFQRLRVPRIRGNLRPARGAGSVRLGCSDVSGRLASRGSAPVARDRPGVLAGRAHHA